MQVALPSNPWLRSAWWDTAFLSFCWVPYYAFLVLRPAGAATLTVAVLVHAAATFVHRQYVFVYVYGDRETLAQRRAFVYAPLLVFLPLLAAIVYAPTYVGWIFLIDRAWAIWHSVMQKYGIWRIYAGKAGGGLETRAYARRDRAFLIAQYVALIVIMVTFRPETLSFVAHLDRLVAAVAPKTFFGYACAGAILVGAAGVAAFWIAGELSASKTGTRVPRWSFLVSILALYVITIVHGPLIGYLVFGTSHALEYVAFAHHFGEKKYGGAHAGGEASFARVVLASLRRAPFFIAGLALVWAVSRRYERVPVWMAIILATGGLHYLYDGWIWKLRSRSVARPLELGAPPDDGDAGGRRVDVEGVPAQAAFGAVSREGA
jgi:hypothetical protein